MIDSGAERPRPSAEPWWDDQTPVRHSPWAISPAAAAREPTAEPGADVVADPALRRWLIVETWCVMAAFIVPSTLAALVDFARHLAGVSVSSAPDLVPGHPGLSATLAGVDYLSLGALVPLAIALLARSGIGPRVLGLATWGPRATLLPALGLAAAGFASAIAVSTVLSAARITHSRAVSQPGLQHLPHVWFGYGVLVAFVTGITEEVFVTGYLLTRLDQLGWSRPKAVAASMLLRSSYHLYYGVAVLVTVPFGYFAARSFHKRRNLARPIAAHVLYDIVVTALQIFAP